MNYGIFSANEWLYPDSNPADGKREISLLAAGNSFACVQVLCRCETALSVEWIPETDGIAPEINRLLPLYVDKNTGSSDPVTLPQGTVVDYVTRLAPFHVFDPMEPVEDASNILPEGGVVALYLRFPTKSLAAGDYTGALRLTCEGETLSIPASITVAKASVPEKETLRLTNWYNPITTATYHEVPLWSEEYWKVMFEYGKVMRRTRQTDMLIFRQMIDHTLSEDGHYIFCFDKVERLIRMYLALGFSHIEGPHMIYRKSWDSMDYIVYINEESYPAFSEEGQKYLGDFFTAWYDFICRNGWKEITTQHVSDEPPAASAPNYRRLAAQVHQWMPGIPTIDAIESAIYADAVDIMVPKSNDFDNAKETFLQAQKNGRELWYYTCCYPGGKYMNRYHDFELLRTRYLHWINHLYGITGYLHWGLNKFYANGGGVFTGACDHTSSPTFPSGDTHIVYPKGSKILLSARFEMMRSGCEDYELFQLAAKKHPEETAAALAQCVRSMTDYTTDIAVFDNAYAQLLALAE